MRRFRCCLALLALFTLLSACLDLGPESTLDPDKLERDADVRILFIGNSYTYANDLDRMVANFLERLDPESEVLVARYSFGGYRLRQHAADAATPNNPLHVALVSGTPQQRDWDLVILQEQSQIGGFFRGTERQNSLAAAGSLVNLIRATGATTLLLMTWGYPQGDPSNPSYYGDYLAMQNRLWLSYDEMAALTSQPDYPVYVAPVGLAFLTVYNQVLAEGNNPLDTGQEFLRLYQAIDNAHPSPEGTYLAAAVIVASYTGKKVTGMDWQPSTVDAPYAAYLRRAADDTVFGTLYPPRPYPWQ